MNESTDAESDDGRGTGENSSDGELGEPGTKHSGPWKKPEAEPAQKEDQKPQQTTASNYKPPAMRNQSNVSATPRQRAKNIAPDINSEEYFPTLSSKQQQQQQSNEPTGPWGRR